MPKYLHNLIKFIDSPFFIEFASVAMALLTSRILKRRNAVLAGHVWTLNSRWHTIYFAQSPAVALLDFKGLFLLWIVYVKSTICITRILGFMHYFCSCLAKFMCWQFSYTTFLYVLSFSTVACEFYMHGTEKLAHVFFTQSAPMLNSSRDS